MESNLRQKTMRSIKMLYYIKKATQPLVLKVVAIVGLLALGASQVSVTNVIKNIMAMDVTRMFGYSFSAFMQTEVLVQAVLVTTAVLIVSSIVDLVRTHHSQHHAHL